jgi:hypothetical protein
LHAKKQRGKERYERCSVVAAARNISGLVIVGENTNNGVDDLPKRFLVKMMFNNNDAAFENPQTVTYMQVDRLSILANHPVRHSCGGRNRLCYIIQSVACKEAKGQRTLRTLLRCGRREKHFRTGETKTD